MHSQITTESKDKPLNAPIETSLSRVEWSETNLPLTQYRSDEYWPNGSTVSHTDQVKRHYREVQQDLNKLSGVWQQNGQTLYPISSSN